MLKEDAQIVWWQSLHQALRWSKFRPLFFGLLCLLAVVLMLMQLRAAAVPTQHYQFSADRQPDWRAYSPGWKFGLGRAVASSTTTGEKILTGSTQWRNYRVSADLMSQQKVIDMGIVLRVTNAYDGLDAYDGYYVGIRSMEQQSAVVGRSASGWLGGPTATFIRLPIPDRWYHIEAAVVGCTVAAKLTDVEIKNTVTLVAEQPGCTGHGQFGLRAGYSNVIYKHISISPAAQSDLLQLESRADKVGLFPEPRRAETWSQRRVLLVGTLILLFASALQYGFSKARLWRYELAQQERDRYAQRFHDTMAQSFAGIAYQLAGVKLAVAGGKLQASEQVIAELERLTSMVRQCHSEASRTVVSLAISTPIPGADVLALLAERARQKAGAEIKVHSVRYGKSMPLDVNTLNALLQIGFEAINNALLHGRPDVIDLSCRHEVSYVELSIKDDGIGYAQAESTPGYGTRSMEKIARSIKADLDVTSAPGEGTTVKIKYPIENWISIQNS